MFEQKVIRFKKIQLDREIGQTLGRSDKNAGMKIKLFIFSSSKISWHKNTFLVFKYIILCYAMQWI